MTAGDAAAYLRRLQPRRGQPPARTTPASPSPILDLEGIDASPSGAYSSPGKPRVPIFTAAKSPGGPPPPRVQGVPVVKLEQGSTTGNVAASRVAAVAAAKSATPASPITPLTTAIQLGMAKIRQHEQPSATSKSPAAAPRVVRRVAPSCSALQPAPKMPKLAAFNCQAPVPKVAIGACFDALRTQRVAQAEHLGDSSPSTECSSILKGLNKNERLIQKASLLKTLYGDNMSQMETALRRAYTVALRESPDNWAPKIAEHQQ